MPDGNKVKHNKWGTNMSDLIFHAATEQKEWLNLQAYSCHKLSIRMRIMYMPYKNSQPVFYWVNSAYFLYNSINLRIRSTFLKTHKSQLAFSSPKHNEFLHLF